MGLHADHLDLGPHRLDVGRDAGDQATAADRDEHRIDRPLVLAQDLHGDRALAGDHVGVVERMDEGQAVLRLEFERVQVGVGITFAMQHDIAAERTHRIDLELGRCHRHHDHGLAAEALGAERDTLRVVAGRRADHAALQLLGRQMRHLVVGAAQLEAEHRLVVFALEQDLVRQPLGQGARHLERGFERDIVDTRGQDLLQVVGARQGRACRI